MMRGVVRKSEKGLFISEGKFFGIIDKFSPIPPQEGEEWEFEVLRKIKDKRGQEVPILRPVRRIFSFDETRGVFTCGFHVVFPIRISVEEIRDFFGYSIKGKAFSPDGEGYPFSVSWETFRDWEGLPEETKKVVEEEIEKREREKKEEAKEEWQRLKRESKELIEQWKNKWISKIQKEEEELRKRICEIYERLEEIAEEFKTIQVVDLRLITRTYPSHSQTTWIFKFKNGEEKYFRTESWTSDVNRDDEPNRLTGIGLGDWLDVSISEIEKLRDEYEKGYSLRKEREKLIRELEEKLEWWEKWIFQEEKIRFEDDETDLRVYIFRPWGSWLEGQSFKAWYISNVLFEGE